MLIICHETPELPMVDKRDVGNGLVRVLGGLDQEHLAQALQPVKVELFRQDSIQCHRKSTRSN
jgi:hypothetical protein